MSPSYSARYPHKATEAFFDEFLSRLEPSKRHRVVEAILSLEKDPKPADNPDLKYVDTEDGPMEMLLRLLPGISFVVGGREVFYDDLRARHHITVECVTVVYALNDTEKIVWLMYIRKA